ncbi:hypothetical protein Hanom_Chr17g01554091 [Helianthus anomalus]
MQLAENYTEIELLDVDILYRALLIMKMITSGSVFEINYSNRRNNDHGHVGILLLPLPLLQLLNLCTFRVLTSAVIRAF